MRKEQKYSGEMKLLFKMKVIMLVDMLRKAKHLY